MFKRAILFITVIFLLLSCNTHLKDPAYIKLLEKYPKELQKEILESAREGITRVWNGEDLPDVPEAGPNEGIAIRLIVAGNDRGCLAWYRNTGDINQFASYCAALALQDYRYEPVTPQEAEELVIEMAIFSEWEDMKNAKDFVVGFHNLWLIDGVENTILQVSELVNNNITKEKFLQNICKKALLNKDAWKDNKALVWKRSAAIIYSEPFLSAK